MEDRCDCGWTVPRGACTCRISLRVCPGPQGNAGADVPHRFSSEDRSTSQERPLTLPCQIRARQRAPIWFGAFAILTRVPEATKSPAASKRASPARRGVGTSRAAFVTTRRGSKRPRPLEAWPCHRRQLSLTVSGSRRRDVAFHTTRAS